MNWQSESNSDNSIISNEPQEENASINNFLKAFKSLKVKINKNEKMEFYKNKTEILKELLFLIRKSKKGLLTEAFIKSIIFEAGNIKPILKHYDSVVYVLNELLACFRKKKRAALFRNNEFIENNNASSKRLI